MIDMFVTPGFKEQDGKIEMLAPTFYHCGCGGIRARLGSVLAYVNISARQLNQINPKAHKIADRYLKQEHLYEQIPLLSKHQYGVLIDNKLTNGKHLWVDVSQGATTEVAKRFKEMLNVSKPH